MQAYIEKLEKEKVQYLSGKENHIALKEELDLLKEESIMQNEELIKYQRHCHSLEDEVIIKNRNNYL